MEKQPAVEQDQARRVLRKRLRSPAYPGIDLRTAIARAKVLYDFEKRNAAPVNVVVAHWGSNIKSSSGLRILAALKQFGLLIDEGEGEDRNVQLSDRALDILLAPSDDDPARLEAIRAAALSPRIHKTLWETYPDGLPSDATLRSYLVRQLDYNDTTVGQLLKEFRSTIAFARLGAPDIMGDTDRAPEQGEVGLTFEDAVNALSPSPPRSEAQQMAMSGRVQSGNLGGPFISFPLPRGNTIEIRLRAKVSQEDFKRIKSLIDLSEPSLVEEGMSGGQERP